MNRRIVLSRSAAAILCGIVLASCHWASADAARAVNESARDVPVAYDVDVVVVGGGTGAVASAVAAAEAGASVFLAAPMPYLGDDMTATLRLWLEPGETPHDPLAKRIFTDKVLAAQPYTAKLLKFTYETDVPSAAQHQDTTPPNRLADGIWGNPATESVQYDSNVNVVVDLEKSEEVTQVRLKFYQRRVADAKSGFDVARLLVFAGEDKEHWKLVGTTDEIDLESGRAAGEGAVLAVDVGAKTRYLKLAVKKADDASRVLLGEIEVFGPTKPGLSTTNRAAPMPRPLHVKKVLDDALLAAGVKFLYSCYVTDVLRDRGGNPCGVVMANRAGRQAVVAKTIIDATDRGWVARMAGAKFRPFSPGPQTLRRVVIGGKPRAGEGMTSRIVPPPFHGPFPNNAKTSSGTFDVIEYTLRLPVEEDTAAAWAKADVEARAMTYDPEQQFTSDEFFQVPTDPVHARQSSSGAWQGVDALPLGAFRPAGVSRLYVLGGDADISRVQAEHLLRPLALMAMGRRIGEAAAAEAAKLPSPVDAHLPGMKTPRPVASGDVGEVLAGVRPGQKSLTVHEDARALPVLGEYDVVVIGGGTAGAPAGIAAARQGAKTVVVEYLHGLGGVGTSGAISTYYWGNRVGFTKEVGGGDSWVIEQKMQWYRDNLVAAGADVWFGTLGCGAVVDKDKVVGVVVATPRGRGVVLAKVVIDATGNADVAAAASAECIYTDETEFAMQGTGLPARRLGAAYENTDFTVADETDLLDVWRMFVHAKDKYPEAFDQGKLIDTRERRRIVGDYTLTILDQMNHRTFPDTVVRANSNFDTHGYTIDPYLMLEHPEKKGVYVNVPYRCLLPRGLDGLLVAGLGASAHRDAIPLIRMQPDLQNQGYAAGVAAAMAVKAGVAPRAIDVRALQRDLVAVGNLPESVLTEKDSYPLPPEQVAAAVKAVGTGTGAAVILANPEQALPLLKREYAAATGSRKLAYAKFLCVLGDPTGLATVMDAVAAAPGWDRGWNYRAMGQFGLALSPLDNLIVAMGRARRPEAVPVILDKLKLLSADSDFSHHRAVALALELIGDPRAAKPLAELLRKPGMTGFAQTSLERVRQLDPTSDTVAIIPRRVSLRELLLARALYRCGDDQGLGKAILTEYAKDLRGHLARHAKAVLDER